VSGRITATFPLPVASSERSADIAENVRLSELTDICGVDDDDEELLLLVLLLPLVVLEEEELLHAAAARHKASDADAMTAPFLATRIMSNHLAYEESFTGPHPGMRTYPRTWLTTRP
jgi:hypothetical protein